SSLMEIKPEFYCRFQLNRYFCSQPTSLMNYSTILLKAIPYKKLLTRIFMLILPISAISCQSDSERRPNVENIDVNISIKRLEQELFEIQDKEALRKFLETNEVLTKEFFQVAQYPHDSILVNSLFQLIQDQHIDTIYQES